jgi:hypothetical protein
MRSNARPQALISAWYDFQLPAVRVVADMLQRAVRSAAPDLVETVKWGNLVFQLERTAVLAIAPHKAHVSLQVFNGAQLPPSLGALDGAGRGLRSLRCRLHQSIDPVQVEMLVAASVALARLQAAARLPRMAPEGEGGAGSGGLPEPH